MRATFAPLALAALAAANPMPQGVTSAIAPKTSAPAGCAATVPGTFEIELVTLGASKREEIAARDTILVLSLNNGILTDAKGRIGSIVNNGQFQFDGPPAQEGALYTAGWSLCPNNTLTLGGETIFWKCLTSTYYNIYDMSVGGQCSQVHVQAINKANGAAITQSSDGQPGAASAVTQYTDGQPQGPTGVPVSQYSDGQPQGPTGTPVSQYSDGQPQAPTGMPVSQYSDGQPQAPTGMPVSQYSDGQPQAPTGMPVSQYSDGQPQAPTGNPVSQYSDGQPQAPAATATPSRAMNTTMKATSGTMKPTSATASPIAATGAAMANVATGAMVAAGVFAAMLF